MPLRVMMALFATEADARRALGIYVEKGVVSLLEGGEALPRWGALAALRDMRPGELQANDWMLALTDKGRHAFESGNWEPGTENRERM